MDATSCAQALRGSDSLVVVGACVRQCIAQLTLDGGVVIADGSALPEDAAALSAAGTVDDNDDVRYDLELACLCGVDATSCAQALRGSDSLVVVGACLPGSYPLSMICTHRDRGCTPCARVARAPHLPAARPASVLRSLFTCHSGSGPTAPATWEIPCPDVLIFGRDTVGYSSAFRPVEAPPPQW